MMQLDVWPFQVTVELGQPLDTLQVATPQDEFTPHRLPSAMQPPGG